MQKKKENCNSILVQLLIHLSLANNINLRYHNGTILGKLNAHSGECATERYKGSDLIGLYNDYFIG